MKLPAVEIVTANRLSDGRVVFLAADGWTRDIAAALVPADKEALDAALARAAADAAANLVVEPYAIAVRRDGATLVPERLRERIRVGGPTTGSSRLPARHDRAA